MLRPPIPIRPIPPSKPTFPLFALSNLQGICPSLPRTVTHTCIAIMNLPHSLGASTPDFYNSSIRT